jgi:hypothetical protein
MGGESTHRRRYFLHLQALRIEPFMLLSVVESTVMNTIGKDRTIAMACGGLRFAVTIGTQDCVWLQMGVA